MILGIRVARDCQILAVFILSVPGFACTWDRDTLGDETRNYGNLVDVVTGRFPRNPPLYYEMRLERVSKATVTNPDRLELYDDGGVACDRLNRGAEAMQWMERKRAQLEKMSKSPATKDHWYRYHANLGTFQAHQWIRDGAYTTATAVLKEGADNIEKAIKINPEAHFGREQYQLELMRWLISKPDPIHGRDEDGRGATTFLDVLAYGKTNDEANRKKEWEAASTGLVGLIYLGNAWESVDVFYTLALIHGRLGNSSVNRLCMDRVRELLDAGKLPILAPLMEDGDVEVYFRSGPYSVEGEPEKPVSYKELRANADIWQQHRLDYMMERLKAGRHPDTDKDFWDDYKEIPAMRLPKEIIPGTNVIVSKVKDYAVPLIAGGLLVAFFVIRDLLVWLNRKKNGAGDRT